MITIPNTQRTISQLVETQLPEFIQQDYPQFISFLRAYYEWLETNGADVFKCNIVTSTANSAMLSAAASTTTNAYCGMNLVVLNGPAKGFTRKVVAYDAVTKVVTVEPAWSTSAIPPSNSSVVIRDTFSPSKLLDYRDIDATLDQFVQFFNDEFMYDLPGTILADRKNILKHIKDFYQARGTEASFRFLFRILFNEEIEFYYPKVDLFRASDARWSVDNVMCCTTSCNTFDFVNRMLVGTVSGATATVEAATQSYVHGQLVTQFTLSSVDGEFQIDPETNLPELVKISYVVDAPPQSNLGSLGDLEKTYLQTYSERPFRLLQSFVIDTPGADYQVGDVITTEGVGVLSHAMALVTAVQERYYNGRCPMPPVSYYLEPFFGPGGASNMSVDPMQDGVCIPGMYYFSDVRSSYMDIDRINANQINLAANESKVENFFVGDEIAIVAGTGRGQRRTIVSYNGVTNVATVDAPFSPIPDTTTEYCIVHQRGGIKAIRMVDFGLGFDRSPLFTIQTAKGSGAVLIPILGVVGQTAGAWGIGREGGISGAATTTDSFLNSNKVIQDSNYWQDFSYDLRVGQTIDKYRNAVKKLLHPAGLKMFGSVVLKTELRPSFFKLIKALTLELEASISNQRLAVSNTTVLDISTQTATTLGATNRSFDRMKFFAFPPNTTYNLQYSFPNQTYWSPSAPGNTQINNLKDIVVGDLINYPGRRTNIAADAYVHIDSGNASSLVGPVGQSNATISRFRFTGFPPYQGFAESYPTPNGAYWDVYGNTQLDSLKDFVIADLVTDPRDKRSNLCVDSDVGIYRYGDIPVVGNLCQYAFVPGMDSQIVYNVGPTAHGQYDAVRGNSVADEDADGSWVSGGLRLSSITNQSVNAMGIPVHLDECTVIVVAMAPGVSANMTLASSVNEASDNGFSIDLEQGGGIAFRAQYGGTSQVARFPVGTITAGSYFMSTLRFDHGRLTGNVGLSDQLSVQFPSYPSAPIDTADGWYFGRSSGAYVSRVIGDALAGRSLYGQTIAKQTAVTLPPVEVGYFDGILAYALFYDRAIEDFELDFIHDHIKEKLLTERQITLA